MFSLRMFYRSAIDGHSEREVLVRDIFKYKLEKCYCTISFLKPVTNWSIVYIVSRDWLTQYVKDDEFFVRAKFWFSAIIYAEG